MQFTINPIVEKELEIKNKTESIMKTKVQPNTPTVITATNDISITSMNTNEVITYHSWGESIAQNFKMMMLSIVTGLFISLLMYFICTYVKYSNLIIVSHYEKYYESYPNILNLINVNAIRFQTTTFLFLSLIYYYFKQYINLSLFSLIIYIMYLILLSLSPSFNLWETGFEKTCKDNSSIIISVLYIIPIPTVLLSLYILYKERKKILKYLALCVYTLILYYLIFRYQLTDYSNAIILKDNSKMYLYRILILPLTNFIGQILLRRVIITLDTKSRFTDVIFVLDHFLHVQFFDKFINNNQPSITEITIFNLIVFLLEIFGRFYFTKAKLWINKQRKISSGTTARELDINAQIFSISTLISQSVSIISLMLCIINRKFAINFLFGNIWYKSYKEINNEFIGDTNFNIIIYSTILSIILQFLLDVYVYKYQSYFNINLEFVTHKTLKLYKDHKYLTIYLTLKLLLVSLAYFYASFSYLDIVDMEFDILLSKSVICDIYINCNKNICCNTTIVQNPFLADSNFNQLCIL